MSAPQAGRASAPVAVSSAHGRTALPAPERPGARTPFAVLGVLARGPMSGADIARWLDDRIGTFWRESGGQLYPTLAALEAAGHVRHREAAPSGRRGRPATTWTITAAGRRRLARWLGRPVVQEPRRIELLLKLFLAKEPAVWAAHLAQCRAEQAAHLARYRAIEAELDALATRDPRAAARYRATVRYGVRVAEALTAWTDEAAALVGLKGPSTSSAPWRPSRRRPRVGGPKGHRPR